ncbi:MAG: ribonuclease Z [Saprospiraceae bacterium]|jgi:ribonuclease Z
MNLTITGYSTALFSTWFFVDELGLLFDAGDGLMSGLMQKSRKVKQVFISHADRDHLTGLLQFNQLNAREGFPIIHYPDDSESFPALENFSKKFDPHVDGTIWKPIKAQEEIYLKENIFVQAIRNNHIPAAIGITKSLSFKVAHVKRKLKPAFHSLTGLEIKSLSAEKGKDFTTQKIITNVLAYSGDTPVEDDGRWDNTGILIHEATFLAADKNLTAHGNKHSTLEEVLKMVANIKIEKLILSHFSSRYNKQQIDEAILKGCARYGVKIPVFRVLPGEIHRDILKEKAVNA